ncbi:hypothetical protein K523DRAFT_421823 [Schizophyllum commune Tattone D]|nr:hypothetical protein K523DRAFT_421823 [Schizophyllum commune Tattone D]
MLSRQEGHGAPHIAEKEEGGGGSSTPVAFFTETPALASGGWGSVKIPPLRGQGDPLVEGKEGGEGLPTLTASFVEGPPTHASGGSDSEGFRLTKITPHASSPATLETPPPSFSHSTSPASSASTPVLRGLRPYPFPHQSSRVRTRGGQRIFTW